MVRRVLMVTAALMAAVVVFLVFTLPPTPAAVDDSAWTPAEGITVVDGVYHIHTTQSDGSGTIDHVAAAAAAAGRAFAILTDHGDATRVREAPSYRSGVLCLDDVEISTRHGHYVALDMPTAPYPLAGEGRDVAEDVARLGGFGVAAHPTSAKPALAWSDWSVPFDGIEWLNGDSEWRDEHWSTAVRAGLDYVVRPEGALAELLDRPVVALARWDALARRRKVVALGGLDAHGSAGLRGRDDQYGDGAALGLPSYLNAFRTVGVRVELDAPLTGDPAADARAIYDAIRAGRTFTAVDALARPARLDVWATSGDRSARVGQTLDPAGPVVLHVRTVFPQGGGEVVIFKDGEAVVAESASELTYDAGDLATAVLRVEVWLNGAPGQPPAPWIVANPVYVGPRLGESGSVPPRLPARESTALYTDEPPQGLPWDVELDPESRAALNVTPTPGPGAELAFRYALRGMPIASQYAALARPLEGGLASFDRVTFRARASRPMRVEFQIRRPDGVSGQRWERSVYLDEDMREVTVFFDDMHPIGPTDSLQPDLSQVDTLLFVVDTTHTPPGTAGIVWVDDVALGRS